MPRKPPPDPPPPPVSNKARTKSSKPPEPKKGPTLTALRSEIDRIDKQLVELLNQRSSVAIQIGQIKQDQGLDIWSSSREDEVLARVLEASRGPLPHQTLRLIFRELMSSSRSLQRQLRVAFLGPKYSYSHLASVAKFGEAVEHVPVGSIAAVFEEVNRRHVQFGIVPLENSTDGRIADTLDMFVRLPGLKIRAEVRLRVRHCLLGKGDWGEIRRVYSKAQALSQCRNWLGKNLPQASTFDVVSSAHAADLAQKDPQAAAIASKQAAAAYGLQVLVENIEDLANNTTRFAVIAERGEQPTGKDKTTMILRLSTRQEPWPRRSPRSRRTVWNMTWIESFPSSESTNVLNPSYLFFADIDGHVEDEPVKRTLEQVRKRCDRLEILGSYPKSESIES